MPSVDEQSYEFDLDDLDIDKLLSMYTRADARLIRATVAARASLREQIASRCTTSREAIGPLLVAIRALDDAFFVAIGGEPPDVQAGRASRNAAALVVLSGGATIGMMQNLRGVGAVGHAVEITLREFCEHWLKAKEKRHVAALWDTAALYLSSLLPRATVPTTKVFRTLVAAAVRAMLPQGHPRRTPGEWGDHVAALMNAGGVQVASGNSLKVALHNYRKKLPRRR
jgi:hypothetical protein